jgi:CheY-like chemotaxis protein
MSGTGGMNGGPSVVPKARKLILLVDDDADIRAMVARALSSLYEVRQAVDGLAALDELAKLPSAPDLIILDIMMPNSDGLSFAAKVKADRTLRSIPLMFLTAKASPSDVIRGIQAGARAYLTKPFNIETLRDKVARALL